MKRSVQSIVLLVAIVIPVSYLPLAMASGFPDLHIAGTSIRGGEVVNEGVVNLNVSVENSGEDVYQTFCVAVEVDGSIVDTEEINGLRSGIIKNVTFILSLAPGDHLIRIIADFYNWICEENEQNNEKIILVHVRETKPDLFVSEVEGFEKNLTDGKNVEIKIHIENSGHTVEKTFNVEITAGMSKKTIPVKESIGPEDTVVLPVNITPRGFDSQKFVIKIDSENVVEESNESNNIWARNVTIYRYLPWYSKDLHYRLPLKTDGDGIAEFSINIENLLSRLGLTGCTFDNNSVRLIEYDYSGVENDSVIYCYNIDENGMLNLKWLAEEGYYMMYFDVVENGNKNRINCADIEDNATVNVKEIFSVETWNIEISGLENHSAIARNSTYSLIVRSNAEIENVRMDVYRDGSFVKNISFDSSDSMNFTGSYTFSKDGNYTLNIVSTDKAGYEVSESLEIAVREADIVLSEVSLPESIYRGTPAAATVKIDTNVVIRNLTICMKLVYEDGMVSFFNVTKTLKSYHEEFPVSFSAKESGNVSMEVRAYLPENVPDKDPENNVFMVSMFVLEPPDIKVMGVSASHNLSEERPAVVYALIKNSENESVEARVLLYIAKGSLDWSPSKVVYSKLMNLPPHSVVNVSLIWENPKGGRWMFGVEARTVGVNDGNIMDNRKVGVMEIKTGDETPPVIEDLSVDTGKGEVGYPVRVFANISDENGISDAKVCLIYPDGHTGLYPMILINNSWYSEIDNLTVPGYYMLYIEATDGSYLSNVNRSNIIKFDISEDYTPPLIQSVFTIPCEKQLIDEPVTIGCIIRDNVAVREVNITIVKPNGEIINGKMDRYENDLFMINRSFSGIGKYSFFIGAEDVNGNRNISGIHTIWITKNLNDTDSDGIPDWWEKMYGLNPKNPDDVTGDMDGDGFTEIKEYMDGLNPTIPNTVGGFSQYEMLITMIIGLTLLPMMIVIILSDRRD